MSDPSDADFSLLLWTLALLVAGLSWHLSNSWVRLAQRGPTLRSQWPALAQGAAALGLGLNAALVLGLQAQPLAFALGFHAFGALGLLLAALLVGAAVVALPAAGTQAWRLVASGVLMALLALGLQMGWVLAAGFRPGVLWRMGPLAAAGVVLAVGLVLARWMAFSAACEASPRRLAWRLGAAVLGAFALLGGQALVSMAAGLDAQRGSLFERQLHGTVLSLVCGVLVPLVMGALALDLWVRASQRPRRSESGLQPRPRRRKRRRMRTL